MMLKGVSFVHGEVIVLIVLACVPGVSLFLVGIKFVFIYCAHVVVVSRVTACTAIMYSFRGMLPLMSQINEVYTNPDVL
jgi:hypothetical protein